MQKNREVRGERLLKNLTNTRFLNNLCSTNELDNEENTNSDVIKMYYDSKNIFGVCLGQQAIAEAFGGTLRNLKKVYHGVSSKIKVTDSDLIFDNIESELEVGRYHSWIVDKPIPNDFKVTSIDENGEIMSIKHKDYNVRGVQFHPESVLTPKGKIILKNWINSL